MTRMCNNCGTLLTLDQVFCGECGRNSSDDSTPKVDTKSINSNYKQRISPEQQEVSEKKPIPLQKKLLAPIIFDKSTIKSIGDDETGTYTALALWIFNCVFILTSPLFTSSYFYFPYYLRFGRSSSEFLFFGVPFVSLVFILIFLVFSLGLFSWGYTKGLKMVDANHQAGEIFRMVCYSSNWFFVLAVLTYIIPFPELVLFIFYLFPISIVFSISTYTGKDIETTLRAGIIAVAITWIGGLIIIYNLY